jgi:hypothetical protein
MLELFWRSDRNKGKAFFKKAKTTLESLTDVNKAAEAELVFRKTKKNNKEIHDQLLIPFED